MEKLTEFDVAEYLDTEELQKGYLECVAQENDPAELLKAISDVARAKEMAQAKKTDAPHDALSVSLLPEGNPAFLTVCNILRDIGYTLAPVPLAKA